MIHQCPKCKVGFPTFGSMVEHQLSHIFKKDGKIACYCDELTTFESERDYLNHCEELFCYRMNNKGCGAHIIRHYYTNGLYIPVKGGRVKNA